MCIDTSKIGKCKCSVIFCDSKENVFFLKSLNDTIVGGDKFNYEGYKYSISNNNLSFKLDIDEFCENIMYAFYILQNNQPIKKIWYTKNKGFEYKLTKEGTYSVQFFIKTGNNDPVIGISNKIKVL